MKTLWPLILALGLAGPAVAYAQANPPELTPEHFSRLDRDGSGGIDRGEYEQFMRESFSKLDVDRSRTISKAEAAKVLTPAQFAQVDQNGDGEITLDEFITHMMRDFDRWDRNQDGQLQP